MAFKWIKNINKPDGYVPMRVTATVKNTEAFNKGVIYAIAGTGPGSVDEVAKAATAGTNWYGLADETNENAVDSTTLVSLILLTPGDVLEDQAHTSATNIGAQLDVASGGAGLTTDSNHDFDVFDNAESGKKTQVLVRPARLATFK